MSLFNKGCIFFLCIALSSHFLLEEYSFEKIGIVTIMYMLNEIYIKLKETK
jgi:hypothetical protein